MCSNFFDLPLIREWRSIGRVVGFALVFVCFSSGDVLFALQEKSIFSNVSRAKKDGGPNYRWDKFGITKWLFIGPIPKQNLPGDPWEFLGDPVAGKEVTFPNGKSYKWTSVKTKYPLVSLDAYCGYEKTDNIVVYGYRIFDTGRDRVWPVFPYSTDNLRIWMDGKLAFSGYPKEENGQPNWFQDGVVIEKGPKGCLVEVSNTSGPFEFSVVSGDFIGLRLQKLGSEIPYPDVLCEILVNGEVKQRVRSDKEGIASFNGILKGNGRFQVRISTGNQTYFLNTREIALAGFKYLSIKLPSVPTFRRRVYGGPEGIPNGQIFTATSLPGGNLLVASSSNGICEYNGLRFRKSRHLSAIKSSDVLKMVTSANGTLWVATKKNGVYRLKGDQLFHFIPEKFQSELIDFVIDSENCPWLIASSNDPLDKSNRLFQIRSNKVDEVLLQGKRCPVSCLAASGNRLLAAEEGGRIWIIDSDGKTQVRNLNDAVKKRIEQTKSKVQAIVAKANGDVILSATQDLFVLSSDGSWSTIDSGLKISSGEKVRMVCAENGTVWILANGRISRIINDVVVTDQELFPMATDLIKISNGSVLVTENGCREFSEAWSKTFGTEDGIHHPKFIKRVGKKILISQHDHHPSLVFENGIPKVFSANTDGHRELKQIDWLLRGKRFDSEFSSLNSNSVLNSDQNTKEVYCVEIVGKNDFLIGTDSGLRTVQDRNVSKHPLSPTTSDGRDESVRTVAIEPNGAIWTGVGKNRLLRIEEGELTEHRISIQGEPTIQCTKWIPNQGLWVGTDRGLFHFSGTKLQPLKSNNPIEKASIVDIVSGEDGAVWIATERNGLHVWRDGVWLKFPLNHHVSDDRIVDIEMDSGGELWVATEREVHVIPSGALPCHISIGSVQDQSFFPSKLSDSINVPVGESLKVSLGSIGHPPLAIRYRETSHSPWKIAQGSTIDWKPSSEGNYLLEFQGLDSSFSTSNSVFLKVRSSISFWERSGVRITFVILLIAFGLASILGFLLYLRSLYIARLVAQKADRDKEILLGRVAHDLKTPVSIVQCCAELLEADQIQSEVSDLLETSSQQMNFLTDQLLVYSRGGLERETKVKYVRVQKLLEFLVKSVRLRTPNSIHVHSVFEGKSTEELQTDQNILTEILINLLDNAIKYTRRGEVEVRFGVDRDRQPFFVVSDTGVGMSPEFIARAFGEFTRENNLETSSGIGLGLYICAALSKKIHGNVSIESELNVGSTVTLTLPSSSIIDDSTETDREDQGGRQKTMRVAIIDDDHEFGISLKLLLESRGHEVFVMDLPVDDSTLQAFEPDFIFTDLLMNPFDNGIELASQLRSYPGFHFPFVAMSSSPSEIQKANDCGDLFVEVINKNQLIKDIDEVLLRTADVVENSFDKVASEMNRKFSEIQ